MSQLLVQVRVAVRTRHYSIRTEEACLRWIREYILFFEKRHPAELGAADVSAFVAHREVRDGKGGKDRFNVLPTSLSVSLERQLEARKRLATPRPSSTSILRAGR